jgi:tetratricopeptide (TPR) repeat protein
VSVFRGAVILALVAGSILAREGLAASNPSCGGAQLVLESVGAALDEGRFDDADRLLQPLVTSHPDCGRVTVGRARLLAVRGDAAEAERLFSRALTQAPDDADVHALFARFQLSRGLVRQAANLIAQALALDPDCVDALVLKGQLQRERGLPRESRAALERALVLDPNNADAHYEIGVWFFRINQFEQAKRHFESAVALGPQRARSLDYLAFSLEMLGEPEAAESNYRAAIEANSKPFFDPTLDFNFGRFLLKQGRLEEGLTHIDRAIELFPNRRGPRYERAKLHLARGDLQAARKDAERALALGRPGDMVLDLQVYYLLTTIYTRLGDSELARQYAELARTAEIPEHAEDLR